MDATSPGPTIGIRLNGQPRSFSSGTTLAALLAEVGKDAATVAIERNGEIVRRARFGDVMLEPGDSVEIVQFVQGG